MKMEMKEEFSTKKDLIVMREEVGNKPNQKKLLRTCTNVMANCQNSIK